ncbi:hypothetical protein TA3x_005750 (plasmid) [Tundrisphaera sp. TA3]|uniref:hypothetical protein n=1 Tax=Tundrisphaera sp. TA3 TaxID=3435775 RepID=UPI003EB7EB9C
MLRARFSRLDLDRRIFDAGLASPALWTDRAGLAGVGLNWFSNPFAKISFVWAYDMDANPVLPNEKTRRKQLTSDRC